MKRLFTLGCSHTRYFWPSWADILGRSFDDYENWGHSGIGNKAIFERTVEMLTTSKPTPEDLIVVQWSNPYRFDAHKIDPLKPTRWAPAGNISKWPQEYSDAIFCEFSFAYHTCNYIIGCKNLLENKGLRFVFFSMNDLKDDMNKYPELGIYKEEIEKITWMPAIFDWFQNSSLPRKSFYMLKDRKLTNVVDEHLTPWAHYKFLETYWPKEFEVTLDKAWAQKAEDVLNGILHYDMMPSTFKNDLGWAENEKVIKGL